MAYTSLMDGGLSVTIGGTEYKGNIYGLDFGSTTQGDGGAGFWLEVSDPFNPQADYPALWHGQPVIIQHTYDAATTTLYRGWILTDPRAAVAGERAFVNVLCGGPAEVAKWREDLGWVFTDADTDQWFANKRNAPWAIVDTDGGLYIGAPEDQKVPRQRAVVLSYVPYLGAGYLLLQNGGPNAGVKRITGTFSCDLGEKMKAALRYSTDYTLSRVPADAVWTDVHTWGPGGRVNGSRIDYTFGGSNGVGHLAFMFWTNDPGGAITTDERWAQIDDCVVYTATAELYINEAMTAIANQIDLDTSQSTATIGSTLSSVAARPYCDPIDALASLALQADRLVEWGWFRGQWRCRPLETNPTTIRALAGTSPNPACYKVNAQNAGVDWDVTQHPEDGISRALRVVYGKVSRSTKWPAGTPASTIAPASPGFSTGSPFLGYMAPVMVANFGHNWGDEHAKKVAQKLARHLGTGLSSGTVRLRTPTVPIYAGGTRPSTYIQGGDFIEEQNSKCGPLYVTGVRVNADTDEVTLQAGLSGDTLIDQLVGTGSVYARRHTRTQPAAPPTQPWSGAQPQRGPRRP